MKAKTCVAMAAGPEPVLQVQTVLPAITYPVGINYQADQGSQGGQYILASSPTHPDHSLYTKKWGNAAGPCYIKTQKFERRGEGSGFHANGTRWATKGVKRQMQAKQQDKKVFGPAADNLHFTFPASSKWTCPESFPILVQIIFAFSKSKNRTHRSARHGLIKSLLMVLSGRGKFRTGRTRLPLQNGILRSQISGTPPLLCSTRLSCTLFCTRWPR